MHGMDARAQKIMLKCPCGGMKPKRVHTTTTATDVFQVGCLACLRDWTVIVRPLKATPTMVVRQVEWVQRTLEAK